MLTPPGDHIGTLGFRRKECVAARGQETMDLLPTVIYLYCASKYILGSPKLARVWFH